MKIIITLLLLSVVSSVYSQGEHSILLAIDTYLETIGAQFREVCIQESGVDRALVEKLEKKAEMANDRNLKCYLDCHFSKAKLLDENGIVDMNALKTVLKATSQKFLDMVEASCKHPKHTDVCEAAYEGCLCVFGDTLVNYVNIQNYTHLNKYAPFLNDIQQFC